jgi:parvulin-like peptidyl-prolyl isomerase
MAYARRQSFEDEIVISDEEIQEYYQENIDEFSTPEEVFVRQIFLRGRPGSEERQDAVATLQELRAAIAGGESFEDFAAEYSQAPGAEEGGVIGWQQRGDLVLALESAAFALEPGEVSQIVETPFGVHLLKVDERREAGVATLDDVRLEIEPRLRNAAADKRYQTWLNDLRKRSRVRIFL